MRINGNVIGANNRPTSNTANGVWRWDASTMHRLYNQFPTYTAPPSSTQAQGSTSGYTSGGSLGVSGAFNTIDKFPFASNANATDVGDLSNSTGRYLGTGQSSTTNGYTSGGYSYYGGGNLNIIDKFPFATNANATDVGDLTSGRLDPSRQGQISPASGYVSGGSPVWPRNPTVNVIEKFPFASNANASDVGDLTVARLGTGGQSSTTSGYTSGGNAPSLPNGPGIPSGCNIIDKFPFASDANATDVGDLTVSRTGIAQSSSTHGYHSGGGIVGTPPLPANPGGTTNAIDKFPFASDANATDVGDLLDAGGGTGQSSTTNGYSSGSGPFPPNVIQKFPFATDANATDVGDLSQARFNANAGQQV